MCGICGVVRSDGAPIDGRRLNRMCCAMVQRGPDAGGEVCGPGFALGHRRLAIIDLSEAGRQPMANEDGSVQVVFNGEIYNFQVLRDELIKANHQFRSRTDSEVLVHGYEEWGLEQLLKRLRGMFAFALMDLRTREIHLARDPLGKKPLFFRHRAGEVIFASSARALSLADDSSAEVDPRAISDLLSNLYVPGPRTIFAGMEKLLPGHAITFDAKDRRIERRYWAADFFHPEHGVTREQWLDRIEEALTVAVKRRLIADVPLGVLLSGGVDSSLVTAVAAKTVGIVRTFSVAADDTSLDESPYARAVAERYATDHRVLNVAADVEHLVPLLVSSLGEPMADASALNFVAISALARESVTVVLTGDGGDEGFGGYSTFWAYFHAERLAGFLPAAMRPRLGRVAESLQSMDGFLRRAGTVLSLAALPVEHTFRGGRWLADTHRDALFTDAMKHELRGHDSFAHYRSALRQGDGMSVVDRVMQAHLLTTLPDDYLAKVDAASMAVSLEARSPFLDQDLIELAMRIPVNVRFADGTPKSLLRQLAYRHLPRHVVDRRKQGFVAPVGKWLRGSWRERAADAVLGPHVERRGWFKRAELERVVAEHNAGLDRSYLLWTLMMLELWLRSAEER